LSVKFNIDPAAAIQSVGQKIRIIENHQPLLREIYDPPLVNDVPKCKLTSFPNAWRISHLPHQELLLDHL
jgi:hypothetical protein